DFAPARAPAPLILFVARDGRDSWSGRLRRPNSAKTDGPLASLEGARDAIRRMKQRSPIQVRVLPGDYYLSRPFVLTAADSGSADSPIEYIVDGRERRDMPV